MLSRYCRGAVILAFFLYSCKTVAPTATGGKTPDGVEARIDLVNVKDDKVGVTILVPPMKGGEARFMLPRIIPGTYAIADYGRYVESFEAKDARGNALRTEHVDVNTWVIYEADRLTSVHYFVNDTYDTEKGGAFDEGSKTIFSPAGTNILAGEIFILNLCGFIGYFKGQEEVGYKVAIDHPRHLSASTSMVDEDRSETRDVFRVSRYAEVVDHPVMYSRPDVAGSKIGGTEVMLSVYSPRRKSINARELYPSIERMMKAQKAYLGALNNTPRYAILAYISSGSGEDAKGFGALEHNTSTTAVFGDNMKPKELIHVISHEFFHTLTPLQVHSKEIQYFDFNEPRMSAHLWMYEGFTEYFAQHFQVNQGLVSEDYFLDQMASKVRNSRSNYRDDLSFTNMSKNVLDPKMKAQYPNVYEKGALMAMCMDIILREKSGGKDGILKLMGELRSKYGPEKPFDDDSLISEFTRFGGSEIRAFIDDHVVGGKPVDYDFYLSKVGVTKAKVPVPSISVFMKDMKPSIFIDTVQKKVMANIPGNENDFFKGLGVQDRDEIISFNGALLSAMTPMEIIMSGVGIDEEEPVTMQVRREGRVIDLSGKARLSYGQFDGYRFSDSSRASLKNAWLKN